MLNSTIIIRYLEDELGYRFNELEISSDEIIEKIRQYSLYTYSRYYPYSVRTLVDVSNSKVPGYENRYYLKTDYNVLSVKRVYLNDGSYGDTTDVAYYYRNISNVIEAQLLNDVLSGMRVPTTFEYFSDDNSIEIYPNRFTKQQILVEMNCVHLDDFSTIPDNMREEFLKLCLYDVQKTLYQIRHRFANLQTAFGGIELFIDDLQSANDKREELLEKWRRNFNKSPKRKKIYIA